MQDTQTADAFADMTWLNPPASFERQGGIWRVRCKPKTDFWRQTFYGYIADSGHFLHRTVSGKFTFEARVVAPYAEKYDQAGLMVRIDAENWMKCGTEFFDGARHASTVFTRHFSEWAVFPDLSHDAGVWWRIERHPDALQVSASADGKAFQLVRLAYFPPSQSVELGIMCCAPTGEGFEATFDQLKLG